jgi:plasmid stabilization system protein ParE
MYQLVITEPAERDRDNCFDFIAQRNPEAALRWLHAFEAAAEALLIEPHYGRAPESDEFREEIRQKLFKTSKGRRYRLLYVVRGQTVYILHVRGPGQDLMHPDDVELPEHE